LEDIITAFVLSVPRAMMAILTLPLLAKQVVPAIVRGALALGIAGFVAAGATSETNVAGPQINFVLLVIKEAGLGLLLSVSFGVLFWAIQAVGDYIDFFSGLTQSQQSDPFSGNQTSPLSMLFGQLSITFFIASGGLVAYAIGLVDSYSLWPPSSYMPVVSAKSLEWFAVHSGLQFSFGLLLLSPILVVLFLVDLGFGWVAKSAQGMDIQSITGPIKALVALLLLAFSLPAIFDRLLSEAAPFATLVRSIDAALK
jgi:type III secretion protein T